MRRMLPVLILAPLLLLGGCDAFFTNVFEGLYTLEVPSAAELGTLPVSDLERLAEDDQFFEELAGDPAKEDAVLENLDNYFGPEGDGTVDTPEEQRAAALHAEVLLRTSGAFDILSGNSFSALQNTLDQFELAAESEYPNLIASLVLDLFDGRTPDVAEIGVMLTALTDAWAAYQAIGAGLDAGASLDPDLNAGEILQFAAVGAVVQGAAVTAPMGADLADLIDTALRGGDVSGFTITFTAPGIADGDPLHELMVAAGFDPEQI